MSLTFCFLLCQFACDCREVCCSRFATAWLQSRLLISGNNVKSDLTIGLHKRNLRDVDYNQNHLVFLRLSKHPPSGFRRIDTIWSEVHFHFSHNLEAMFEIHSQPAW